MARVNTEECWWSDPRRSRLAISIGSQALADGMVLNAWRLAQEFWSRGKLIPWNTFSALEGADALLKVGLARTHEQEEPSSKQIEANASNFNECFVYVRGSSEYLSWTRDRREAARQGGLKSADARRRNSQIDPENDQAKGKQTEANSTKSNQTQPSGSGSGSIKENTYEQRKRRSRVNSAFDLETLYQEYPRKKGKTPGLKKLAKEILSQEDFNQLAAAIANYSQYVAGKDIQYVMYFDSFAMEWRDWIQVEPEGNFSINTTPISLETT